MEQLLHYVWKHKIFPLEMLRTTSGKPVEVIDPDLSNPNAGPDFFNSKLRIDGVMWVGNVEIHSRASDWYRHGHDKDVAYNNIVLHVAEIVDSEVQCSNGESVPQIQLSCPESVKRRYDELRRTDFYPPCYSIFPSLSQLTVHSWLSALQVERYEQKSNLIIKRLDKHAKNWEDVFFITLARNFGFGLNGDAFEKWADSLPFRAVDKHRDNLLQVEAFFFGEAGLLEEEDSVDDAYFQELRKEYVYLRRKFELPAPMSATTWRFLRLRPGNFPHVRLAQLASLYHDRQSLLSRVLEAEELEVVKKLLKSSTSSYWKEHFTFKKLSPSQEKNTGDNALNLIVINTVIPFLYAYGLHKGNDAWCERATSFLESLKAENNYVTRQWSGAGLSVRTAADSQALLQLQKEYCDKKDCLRCRFGYEYLRQK